MLQKSLGYASNKFRRFYRVPEEVAIFKKIKKYKMWAMNLSSDCLVKPFFYSKLRLSLKRYQKKLDFYLII